MSSAEQIPVQNWYQMFTDPTLADACLDQLVHNAYTMEIAGPSMRKVLAEKETVQQIDELILEHIRS